MHEQKIPTFDSITHGMQDKNNRSFAASHENLLKLIYGPHENSEYLIRCSVCGLG